MDIFLLLCTFLLVAIAIINKKIDYIQYILLFIGIFLMILADKMYFKIMYSGLRTNAFPNPIAGLILTYLSNIGISDTKIVSLFGECMILSFYSVQAAKFSKNKLWFLLMVIPIAVYACIGHPDTAYEFYIRSGFNQDSHNRFFCFLENNLPEIKIFIVVFCLTVPYISGIGRCLFTILTPLKREITNNNFLMIVSQMTIMYMIRKNVINNMFSFDISLLYRERLFNELSFGTVPLIIYLINIIALIFCVRYWIYLSYFAYTSQNKYISNPPEVEKTLRSLLHTYKNFFFAIRSHSELAIMKEEKALGEADDSIKEIYNIANNALFIVTKQLEKIKNIEIIYDDVNITDVLEYSVELALVPKNVNIKINIQAEDKVIQSDVVLLSEIFSNLIRNAASAVEKTLNPEIEINFLREASWIVVEVIDNGYGIEKKDLKNIFKPLVSVHQGLDNWGIGLYCVSKITAALNGFVYVTSKPGIFTKFQVFLPDKHKKSMQNYKKRGEYKSYEKNQANDM
ncbi:MAG: HAMP domain-containing histidine kinase [Clostridia bacterium]|nr:HAMP domain-containing histidine kinase [Clostridia bacterium]